MRMLTLVLLVMVSMVSVDAACLVITPAGAGTADGSNWSNACKGFSGSCAIASLVRGDTYHLGAGAYTATTFDTANSSTSIITIKSPTASSHCTDTGFVQGTHVGQATITGVSIIDTDYWTFDGEYGTMLSKGSFGIKFAWAAAQTTSPALWCREGCQGTTIKNLEILGSNDPVNGCADSFFLQGYSRPAGMPASVTFDGLYVYGGSTKLNSASSILVEHSYFTENISGTTCHGENIAINQVEDLIVRYNAFINCAGTACFSNPCGTCFDNVDVEIYGNLFYDDLTRTGDCVANGGTYQCLSLGVITNTGSKYTNLKIYNNTIANYLVGKLGGSTLGLYVNSGGTQTGLDIQNNLFYNNAQTDVGDDGTCLSNSYYSTTRSGDACTGDQINGAGDPFVLSSTASANFHLATDTSAWAALSSPYNSDPSGVTRTSSRGAYQYAAAAAGYSRQTSGRTVSGGRVK